MEVKKQNALSEYVRKEVMTLLSNSVQPVMRGLTRQELLDVLVQELTYLTLSQVEPETPQIVHDVINTNLDRWISLYLDRPPYGSQALKPAATQLPVLGPFMGQLQPEPVTTAT